MPNTVFIAPVLALIGVLIVVLIVVLPIAVLGVVSDVFAMHFFATSKIPTQFSPLLIRTKVLLAATKLPSDLMVESPTMSNTATSAPISFDSQVLNSTATSKSTPYAGSVNAQSKQSKYYSSFKDKETDGLIANARVHFEKLASKGDIVIEDEGDTCAMDLVLRREAMAFTKTGQRSPTSCDTAMRGELAMLLVAGHETTAITLGWGLKTLAHNQVEQSKLRRSLEDAFSSVPPGSTPSASDILSTSIPYLDGALE
ncbi:Reducing polyketide synthase FUB1 [Colletotrichum gloeosporioides]|uniref:Reducing polyketide synthase FUB1 n=1 Tax=Colletotrichum gloeosporioides TaxID=474922 RepID=A0A8H4FDK2_COLGL|nr:Reducing polyketide synthase FUB1 [Colletotrichum gloeosporioides]KAF3797975.1 Reducing polyketide synthase FUB1 [Colletotrichum gloeosporioides]